MDTTVQTLVALVTLLVGIAGLLLNYSKFNQDHVRNQHLDLASDYDRKRDELDAAEKRIAQLEQEVMNRDRVIARLMLNTSESKSKE